MASSRPGKLTRLTTDPSGINQIGCVYNIQGFEPDYVGVIWGKYLRYDLDAHTWIGDKKHSADSVVKRSKERFVDLVKNTYRVLLSCGIKGCYVHFMDKDTERFVRSPWRYRNGLPRYPRRSTRNPIGLSNLR